jgi:Resolvase, N terminal domain
LSVRHHGFSRSSLYKVTSEQALRNLLIDEDLGKSGATAEGRPGFQRLVAEVSLAHVGIVFGLDISRLARSNRDWHHLGTQKLLIIPRSQPGGTISINHFPKAGSRLIWASTRCMASLVKVTPVS